MRDQSSHVCLFPVKMQGGRKSERFLFLERSQVCIIVIIHTTIYERPAMCVPCALCSLLLSSLDSHVHSAITNSVTKRKSLGLLLRGEVCAPE